MKLYPRFLKRYKDIALLMVKYGKPRMFSKFHAADGVGVPVATAGDKATDLPDDLERLGPTFVKLGQLLSSRPDLLPEHHRALLTRLQDRVKPFPFAEVQSI